MPFLSRLYRVLGDFHMSIETLVQNVLLAFFISTLVPLALHCPMKLHLRSG